jgi:hypothetical protein
MRKTLLATTAILLGATIAASAYADQLTLGNSTPGPIGSIDFAGAPTASLIWESPGIGGTTALFNGEIGSWNLGAFGPAAAGPLVGGNFATNATEPFAVTLADGDTLSGTVNWSIVKDNSDFPDLIGRLSVASSSGDATWRATFPTGGNASADVVLTYKPNSGSFTKLDDLAAGGGAEWFTVSSGEFLPLSSPVSEPHTLALLGVALITLGWVIRVGRRIPSEA